MNWYFFCAINKDGEEVREHTLAASEDDAMYFISHSGYTKIKITEVYPFQTVSSR